MPRLRLVNYRLTGPTSSRIYSQKEMATALGVPEHQIDSLLGLGVGLGYHAHPDATGGEGYWFKEKSYKRNIKVWRCYQKSGHTMRPDSKYNYLPMGAVTCSGCGWTKFG